MDTKNMKSTGMLITDDEILERFGDVLPKLDAHPATRSYALWNGARYRPAVEEALRVEHRSKAS